MRLDICPICGQKKKLYIGISGIGLVCSDCGCKYMEAKIDILQNLLKKLEEK